MSDVYWGEGSLLKGQRIICREADGSCWMAITEAEKVLLENDGADLRIKTAAGDVVSIAEWPMLPPGALDSVEPYFGSPQFTWASEPPTPLQAAEVGFKPEEPK